MFRRCASPAVAWPRPRPRDLNWSTSPGPAAVLPSSCQACPTRLIQCSGPLSPIVIFIGLAGQGLFHLILERDSLWQFRPGRIHHWLQPGKQAPRGGHFNSPAGLGGIYKLTNPNLTYPASPMGAFPFSLERDWDQEGIRRALPAPCLALMGMVINKILIGEATLKSTTLKPMIFWAVPVAIGPVWDLWPAFDFWPGISSFLFVVPGASMIVLGWRAVVSTGRAYPYSSSFKAWYANAITIY